jgi:hypothetical protein
MPIPALNANGLLPPGVHDCTLQELRLRFGIFQSSDRRPGLFARLKQLVAELRRSELFSAVIVDGSFVTAKVAPEDIDLIVTLRPGHNWLAVLRPNDYALVSRPKLHRRYGFDVLIAMDGDKNNERYVEFFGRVREDASVRKGMLRIVL